MKTVIYMNGQPTTLLNIFDAVGSIPWYKVSSKHTGRQIEDILNEWVNTHKTYYYLNGIKTVFELKEDSSDEEL